MGFQVYEAPDVETDAYNFQALNIPSITLQGTCGIPSGSTRKWCYEPTLTGPDSSDEDLDQNLFA